MKRLLLLPLLLGLSSPALANLGDAEDGMENRVSDRIYEAWCGSKTNKDCKVKFRNNRMIVNEGTGITKDQLLSISREKILFMSSRKSKQDQLDHGAPCGPDTFDRNRPSCQSHFFIKYKDMSGNLRNALIRFGSRSTGRAGQFKNDIENWSGIKFRKIGPSIKLETD